MVHPEWLVTYGMLGEPPVTPPFEVPSIICTEENALELALIRNSSGCPKRCLVVAPFSDVAAEFIAKGQYTFASFMAVDHSVMMSVSNKGNLAEQALHSTSAGHVLPVSSSVDQPLDFPFYMKKNTGAFGQTVMLVHDRREYDKRLASIPRKLYSQWKLYEAVRGEWEYSVLFLVANGRLVFYSGYKQWYGGAEIYVWPRDVPTTTVLRKPSEIELEACMQFLRKYNGLVNCGYKLRRDDEETPKVVILEFNTRLTGDIFFIPPSDVRVILGMYAWHSITQPQPSEPSSV